MAGRTWALIRARLAMAHRAGWAIPSLFFHGALGTLFAGLVKDTLPPFAHALFALSLGAVLLALPLLSDLGALLRFDQGGEWAEALPATPLERKLARLFHVGILLAALELALVLPFALLAPAGSPAGQRVALVLAGWGLAAFLAAALVWFQALLWPRWENALVLLQAFLMGLIVVGSATLLGHLPELARLEPGAALVRWLPSAWFASAVMGGSAWAWAPAAAATGIAAVALALVPTRTSRIAHGRGSAVERLLEPARRAALRLWVRPEERGAFELVFLALPREREFRLRTLPVLGIPMAFLWIGLRADDSGRNGDLLAILLFTVGVYLPVLLAHVPLSESPGAGWLLRAAPRSAAEIEAGTIKALFVRYLVPLYLLLAGLGLLMGAWGLLLRLWLPAVGCGLVLLQVLYPRCVRDLPLSTAPDDLRGGLDWVSPVVGLALGLTVGAVLANRLAGPGAGLVLAGLAGVASQVLFRSRRRPDRSGPGGPGRGARGSPPGIR